MARFFKYVIEKANLSTVDLQSDLILNQNVPFICVLIACVFTKGLYIYRTENNCDYVIIISNLIMIVNKYICLIVMFISAL